jgi:hypothetical protein
MKKVKTKLSIIIASNYLGDSDFTEALTGVGSIKSDSEIYDNYSTIGLKRKIEKYSIPKNIFYGIPYDKDEYIEMIDSYLKSDKIYLEKYKDGWGIKDYGLNSKQSNKDYHYITLINFCEKD